MTIVGPYATACDQIETDLGTLTPPDNTSIAYVRLYGEENDPGESADRSYYFEYGGSQHTGSAGVTVFYYTEDFEVVVNIKTGGRNVKTIDQALQAEAMAIKNKINARQNWPANVEWVTASSVVLRVSERDPESVELRIRCRTRTANANV